MSCPSQSATPPANMADKKVVTPGKEVLISEPHDNDVLCGRGGSINSHPGNERFRDLVEKRKRVYLTARFKREKRLIASSIVSEIRGQSPYGRFLTKDSKSGLWYDIGDEKARDKTSQALRENAPSIRAEIETEINHHRAEMKQADDDDDDEPSSRAQSYSQGPSPPPYYASNPWGGGYYTPLYGYHPPADAPPPNYPQPGPYQPWEGNSFYGYSGPEQQESPTDQASVQPNQPHRPPAQEQQHSSHVLPSHQQHSYQAQAQQQDQHKGEPTKLTFDTLPSFVSSVPSSIANWTRNSFSFGAHSNASEDPVDFDYAPPDSKPLPYVHRAEGQRPKVTFRDDYHRAHESKSVRHYQRSRQGNHQYRNGYSSHRTRTYRPSFRKPQIQRPPKQAREVPPIFDDDDFDDQNNSLLSQVASHIMGSWETPLSCTAGSYDDLAIQPAPHTGMEEGQEVELVEMMSFDDPIIEEDDDIREDESKTMPPPQDRRVEIDWPSRVGGCHTWLPEAPSFFSANDNPLSPSISMEMDQSAIYSCGGSIGGGSLCQVFANDPMLAGSTGTPQLDHKTLNQIPSWERSFRSRSPSQSTICSNMSADSDLKSMGSDSGLKSMGSGDLGNRGGHISPVPLNRSTSPRNSIITQQNMDRFEGRMMRE